MAKRKIDITKIVIVTLRYKMDLSRLKVIELDNKNKYSFMLFITRAKGVAPLDSISHT